MLRDSPLKIHSVCRLDVHLYALALLFHFWCKGFQTAH